MCSNIFSFKVSSISNRMTLGRLSILLITIISVQAQSNTTSQENNITTYENYTTTEENNITETILYSPGNYNYIIKLSLEMRRDKIPEYLISILYDTEYKNLDISTGDLINLYKLRNLNLTEFTQLLLGLNISVADVVSIDGFEECLNALKLNFKDVYENILVNKFGGKGEPLQKFVSDLEINELDFMVAMAYGYSNVFEVFKKGNFSRENLQKALSNVGKTSEDLFIAIRDEVLDKITQDLNTSDVAALLNGYNFKETQALMLWNFLNISVDEMYANMAFKDILEHISNRTENISMLGIIAGQQYLFLNTLSYSILKVEEEIADIIAVNVNSLSPLTILGRVQPQFTHLVVLEVKSNGTEKLSSINYGISNKRLENCTLVMFLNNTFVEENVREIDVNDGYAELDTYSVTDDNFYMGSPIICNGIVYGLAKFYNGNIIWFDSFHTNDTDPFPVPTDHSGTRPMVYSFSLVMCAFLSVLCQYISYI